MPILSRPWLVAGLLALLQAPQVCGQSLPPAGAPQGPAAILGPPEALAPGPGLPPAPGPLAPGTPVVPDLPPIATPPPGPNGLPFVAVSPTLDFWLALDNDIAKPVLVNHLSGSTRFPDGTMAAVQVPQARLGWTDSVTFEIGKYPDEFLGPFVASYRFLVTSGTGTAVAPDGGTGTLKSNLDFNIADFDYYTPNLPFTQHWDVTARLGFRFAQSYFSSTVSDLATQAETTNFFLGGGIHARLEVHRSFGYVPGLSFLARADGAVVIGTLQQRFLESLSTPFGGPGSGSNKLRHTETMPMLTTQLGLMYTPPTWDRFHIAAGYQFDEWFRLGRLDSTSSNARLVLNGVFLHLQYDY